MLRDNLFLNKTSVLQHRLKTSGYSASMHSLNTPKGADDITTNTWRVPTLSVSWERSYELKQQQWRLK